MKGMANERSPHKDGEHVWINMEHAYQIDRRGDLTVLKFAAGEPTVTVQETPLDILAKV